MKFFKEILNKPLAHFSLWFKKHNLAIFITTIIVIIFIGGNIIFIGVSSGTIATTSNIITRIFSKPKPVVPPVYYSPLTGVPYNDESLTKQPVTGVMIENSPDARPQSGLKNSNFNIRQLPKPICHF